MPLVNEKQHLKELCTSTKFPPSTTFKKCPLWVVSIFFFMLPCVFQVFYTEKNTFKVFFLLPRLKKKIYGAEQCKTSSLITQKLRIHHFWHSSLPTQENKK